METHRETPWGYMAIPNRQRKEFDKLAPKMAWEHVEAEIRESEAKVEQFINAVYEAESGGPVRFRLKGLRKMYEYGLEGKLSFLRPDLLTAAQDQFIDEFLGCYQFNSHLDIHAEFEVSGLLSIIVILNAVSARAALDRYRLTGQKNYLSIQEVALLARMREVSVRNAASLSSKTPLKTEKFEDGLTLVEAAEAERWLSNRRSYIPTDLPEGAEARKTLFSILDSWVLA